MHKCRNSLRGLLRLAAMCRIMSVSSQIFRPVYIASGTCTDGFANSLGEACCPMLTTFPSRTHRMGFLKQYANILLFLPHELMASLSLLSGNV